MKKIQFYVNEKEYEKLKEYAEGLGVSMAEVLRDCIKAIESSPPLRAHDGVLDP